MNDKTELSEKVKTFIRPEIRALSAYHVPDASDTIKLDAMENPYRWPDSLVNQWLDVMRDVELNRYPDPGARVLTEHLRKAMDVPNESKVLLGNGSDELIQMIMMAVAGNNHSVLSVEPGFVMYKMIATFLGMPYIGVPLNEDFSLDEDKLLSIIKKQQPAVIFLAYPNNPTSNLFDEQTIRNIIDAAPGVVVVDEAYHAFAEKSFMPMLNEYDNLLVMRTVSKMGLAGLRLGLLAGNVEWLNEFDKVRLPYNINILTQASAEFAIKNIDVLDTQTQQICHDREELFKQLSAIECLQAYPSQANFILVRVAEGQADRIFNSLKEQGVLIKNLNPAGGLLKDCLRITVGTAEENNKFLTLFKTLL
ncbi:MAG: histidinol-phosphate transaminase [Woeseiaceae bacterium]